jgi:hypothetical protein
MKMRNFFKGMTIIVAVLGIINCSNAQKRESRKVSDFTGIGLSIAANVYLTQADLYNVEIEADADILRKIETAVDDGKLRIKYVDRWYSNFSNKKVNIYISMPRLQELSIAGSGDIVAQSPLTTDNLSIGISGSGDVTIDMLSAKSVEVTISGSGDIKLGGPNVVERTDVAISGSGDVKAENLQCRQVSARISGSGDIRIWAVDDLEARVSGSGDIYYKGRPVVNAKTSGSGGLHHL